MNRGERTLRVTLSEVDFARLCDLAAVMGSTPTELARVAIVHVADELAAQHMVRQVVDGG